MGNLVVGTKIRCGHKIMGKKLILPQIICSVSQNPYTRSSITINKTVLRDRKGPTAVITRRGLLDMLKIFHNSYYIVEYVIMYDGSPCIGRSVLSGGGVIYLYGVVFPV